MATDILEIYNLVLVGLGGDRLATITDDSEPRRKLDAIFDNVLAQLLVSGPEKGWKFNKEKNVNVNIESSTVTAFADYSGTAAGTVLVTTSAAHNLVSGNVAAIEDTTNYDNEYEVTVVDGTNFYITATWVADDAAGTVYWTTEDNYYRFAIPAAAMRVDWAGVSGIELTDWEEQNGYILTAQEGTAIDLNYIKSVTTTTLFPEYFTKLLVLSLQAELVYGLSKSNRFIETLEIKRDRAMDKAIAADEKKKYVKEESSEWVDSGRN